MDKQAFINRSNKGIVVIEGVKLDIKIYPDKDGDEFISIDMFPITPLHLPTQLGGKWLKYTDENEFLSFESEIKKHRERAEDFYKKAQRIVKATIENGFIKIIELPEEVKQDFCIWETEEQNQNAIKRFIKRPHKIARINDNTIFALGNFALDIDGVVYKPYWSYWLDRPFYYFEKEK